MRRKKGKYFERIKGSPKPITIQLKKRVNFGEVDPMGVVWYGRYPAYFEEAATLLDMRCGLTYQNLFRKKIFLPVAQMHIDYHQPLVLGEKISITALLIWAEGARLNKEFVIKRQDGSIATTGYTVQMFINGITREPYLTSPKIMLTCQKRWEKGRI